MYTELNLSQFLQDSLLKAVVSVLICSLLSLFLIVASSSINCGKVFGISAWSSDSCKGVQVWGRARRNHTHLPAERSCVKGKNPQQVPMQLRLVCIHTVASESSALASFTTFTMGFTVHQAIDLQPVINAVF